MKKNTFLDIIQEKVMIFDGAMGTSIQQKIVNEPDRPNNECPEYLNLCHPRLIQEIHDDFLKVGADVVETNSFGALPYLLAEYGLEKEAEQINRKSVQIAMEVARSYSSFPRFVSGSMGPGTKLPSLRQITFDELYHNYYLQAECFVGEGVDLIQIETGQDILQLKSALKAVLDVQRKHHKDQPIFIQATLQENGQMLVGTDLFTFIQTFHESPIHGLGINCGTGPHRIENYVQVLADTCPFLISVLPNAGLPIHQEGKMIYDLSPSEFGQECAYLVRKYNINAIGGCCGTTSDFIRELVNNIHSPQKAKEESSPRLYLSQNMGGLKNSNNQSTYLTSLLGAQEIKTQPAPLFIGERANVNGSKKFKTFLQNNNWEQMLEHCLIQQEEGAHVLDICLTCLNRDEKEDFKSFIPLLNNVITTPIMIDSTQYATVEESLKLISGKAIVNSTNFENGNAQVVKYLKLCRDFNAALVCLTIDEHGMAKTFEHKKVIIERLLNLCYKHSFPLSLIFIDPLTFALTTGDGEYRSAGLGTIETLKYIKANFPILNTVMGVSNVSFGLTSPVRQILNTVYLDECVQNGLTAAIVDVGKIIPLAQISPNEIKICQDLIYNRSSVESGDPLTYLANLSVKNNEQVTYHPSLSPAEKLTEAIIKGRSVSLENELRTLLQEFSPLSIINDHLLPAMKKVGTLFESGKMQLPFVLKSAEIMKKAVDYLHPYLPENKNTLGKLMLIATVQGDVHDIGKNLVDIIITNNGYQVIDLGVKQTPSMIYQAIQEYHPSCLGLSALIIKSTTYMKETLQYLQQRKIDIPIICGGAALTEEFVEKELQKVYTGQVAYGRDAFAGLQFMQEISVFPAKNQMKNTNESLKPKKIIDINSKINIPHRLPSPKHDFIPQIPFEGTKIERHFNIKNFTQYINKKFLYYALWQIKAKDIQNNLDLSKKIDKQYTTMLEMATAIVDPSFSYGYFYANSDLDMILIDCNRTSPREEEIENRAFLSENQVNNTTNIIVGKFNGFPLTDAIYARQRKIKDLLPIFAVTIGKKAVAQAQYFKNNGQYQNYFYWHGFCGALTEALAAYVHSQIRVELGLEKNTKQTPKREFKQAYTGKRFSFGYEALPELSEQRKILNLLQAEEIGITMNFEGMLEPEYSTCALVFYKI